MDTVPNLLVIDDEPGVLKPLREILLRAGYQVVAVSSGEAALEEIGQQEFDLALIDLKLKGIGGLEVLAALRERAPNTAAIILTAHATLDSAVEALRRGAHDYLFKPCRTADLLESVRKSLLKRQTGAAPPPEQAGPVGAAAGPAERIAAQSAFAVDMDRHLITLYGTPLNLTPTEFTLLAQIVQASPRVVSAQELVEKTMGYQSEPWEARELIRFHIHRLRQKIEATTGRADLIRTVRGVGYVLRE